MSHTLAKRVRWKRLDLLPKAVLGTMADVADNDGRGVWMGVEKLALVAGCSARSAQRCLRQLEAEGLIRPAGKRSCRGGFTVAYELCLDNIEALADIPSGPSGDTQSPLPGRSGDTQSPLPGQADCESGDTLTPLSSEVVTVCHPSGDTVSPDSIHEQESYPDRTEQHTQTRAARARGRGRQACLFDEGTKAPKPRASLIAPNWQPDAPTRAYVAKLGFDADEIEGLIVDFVEYWRSRSDRGAHRADFNHTFKVRARTVRDDPDLRAQLRLVINPNNLENGHGRIHNAPRSGGNRSRSIVDPVVIGLEFVAQCAAEEEADGDGVGGFLRRHPR